jgi:ferrous iron transport protein B
MATRTLEHEHDRLATMLVLPLISCGARLTIWMLLIPAFFAPSWRAPALWSLYLVGIVLALALALLMRKTVLCGEDAPFVMELPPFRLPTLRSVLARMTERSWLYLRKAGTVILAISVVMWVITSYPKADGVAKMTGGHDQQRIVASGEQRGAEDLRHSIAGRIGRAIEPALTPLGVDWKVGVALIGAFAAKEVFVAQLGITYAVGDAESERGADRLREKLRRDYTPLSAFALMLFLLIATPCMATLAITRRESGSWKWALLQLGGLTVLGYLVAVCFYQVGRLFVG